MLCREKQLPIQIKIIIIKLILSLSAAGGKEKSSFSPKQPRKKLSYHFYFLAILFESVDLFIFVDFSIFVQVILN